MKVEEEKDSCTYLNWNDTLRECKDKMGIKQRQRKIDSNAWLYNLTSFILF